MTDSRVLAIIPARGGSKGLRRKNLCPIAGKPMVAYSIEAANHCSLVTRTMVTTDDEEIADVARDYGADVPFMRPQELATDLTPTEPVLQHALAYVETEERERVDVVLFLQPTDIFRRDGILNKVIQPLLDNPALDTCFPVSRRTRTIGAREKTECGSSWQTILLMVHAKLVSTFIARTQVLRVPHGPTSFGPDGELVIGSR